MSRRSLRMLCFGALGVVVACTDRSQQPTSPLSAMRGASLQVAQGLGASREDVWAGYAASVPGFGGMYYSDDGDLVVLLKDTTQKAAALSRFATRIGRQHRPAFLPPLVRPPTMRFQPANYDYAELVAFKRTVAARVKLHAADVAYLGIDEHRNVLAIAMTTAAAASTMQQSLVAAGVPAGALSVAVDTRPTSMTGDTVSARVAYKPVVGGFLTGIMGSYCTVGLPITFGYSGAAGFLTAQHCTDSLGSVFLQYPTPSTWDTIATVAVRPSPFSACSYSSCLYADVAVGQFTSGTTYYLGGIAQAIDDAVAYSPTSGTFRADDLYFNPSYYYGSASGPFLTDADNQTYDVSGDWIYKTGYNTGWTIGKIDQTCLDAQRTDGVYILCSVTVVAGVDSGDSGSPVWYPDGNFVSGNYGSEFHGIVWAGNDYHSSDHTYHKFYFSPFWAITYEIYGVVTH